MAAPWPAAPYLTGPALFSSGAAAGISTTTTALRTPQRRLLPHPQPLAVDSTRHVFEPLRQQTPVARSALAAPHSRAFQFLDSELCELGDGGNSSSSAINYFGSGPPPLLLRPTSANANVVLPGEAIVPPQLRDEQLPLVQAPRIGPPPFRMPFAESYQQEVDDAHSAGSGAGFQVAPGSGGGSGGEGQRAKMPTSHVAFVPFSAPPAEQWPVLDPFNNGDRVGVGSSSYSTTTTNNASSYSDKYSNGYGSTANSYNSNNLKSYGNGASNYDNNNRNSYSSSYGDDANSYGNDANSYSNVKGYDNTVSSYSNQVSNGSTSADSYENGTSSYENEGSTCGAGVSNYSTSANSYDIGTSSYDNGVSNYDNGADSYDIGAKNYSNGASSTNQFAAATWTREQHFAPAASTINPCFSDTTLYQPKPSVFGGLQQTVHAAQQERGQRLPVMRDASGDMLSSFVPPDLPPIRSGAGDSTGSPWQMNSSSVSNPGASLEHYSQASASLAHLRQVSTADMSIEEQNEELNRAARTLISDEFLRGLSDAHIFGHPTGPTRQDSLPNPLLSKQRQWPPQQQPQPRSQQQQQQPQQQQQYSYLKTGVPAQSNGHMQPSGANRVAGGAPSHAAQRVAVSVVVGASLPIKKKMPAKRKRAKNTGVADHRSARVPVPSFPMTNFVAKPPDSSATDSSVWQHSMLPANGASNTVARPGAAFAAASFGSNPALAPPMNKKSAPRPKVVIAPGSSVQTSMPSMGATVPVPTTSTRATPKPKKRASAARTKAVEPALPTGFVQQGWFVPDSDAKKKAPPAKRKKIEKPPTSRPRKAAAGAKKGGKPVDTPQLSAHIEFPGVQSADTTIPSGSPFAAATAALAPAIAPTVPHPVIAPEMGFVLKSVEQQHPLSVPTTAVSTDKKTDASTATDVGSDVVWTRPTSGAVPAPTAELVVSQAASSQAPSHPNNTIVIFCKRDFLRYQAVKLWKKYQEKKKKMEFQTVQVLGKRTRYVNSRYEDDAQKPATTQKKKKAKAKKRARKSENGSVNELKEDRFEILDSPDQVNAVLAPPAASRVHQELKNQTESSPPIQQSAHLVETTPVQRIEVSDDEMMELVIPAKLAESAGKAALTAVPTAASSTIGRLPEGTAVPTPVSTTEQSTVEAIEIVSPTTLQSTARVAIVTEMAAVLKATESTEAMTSAETEDSVVVDVATPATPTSSVEANSDMSASPATLTAMMKSEESMKSSVMATAMKIAEDGGSGVDATKVPTASDGVRGAEEVVATALAVSAEMESSQSVAEVAATTPQMPGRGFESVGAEAGPAATTIEEGAEDTSTRAARVNSAQIAQNLVVLMTPMTFEQSTEAVARSAASSVAPTSAKDVAVETEPGSPAAMQAEIATLTTAESSNDTQGVQDALAAAASAPEKITPSAQVVAITAASLSDAQNGEAATSPAAPVKSEQSAVVTTARASESATIKQSAEVEEAATALSGAPANLVADEKTSAAPPQIHQSAADLHTDVTTAPPSGEQHVALATATEIEQSEEIVGAKPPPSPAVATFEANQRTCDVRTRSSGTSSPTLTDL